MSCKRMSADRRRRQIIRAATRLFADNGFDGTRFWQIAAACGISEGAVLHFFRDKQALHSACFNQAIRDTVPDLSGMPDSPEEALREYASRFLHQCREDPDSLRFFLHINLSEPRKNELLYESEAIRGYFEHLERIIVRGRDSGRMRPADTRFSARALIGILFMLAILHEFFPADPEASSNAEELARKAVELFMNGLAEKDDYGPGQ